MIFIIALGSDHVGIELKEHIIDFLSDNGIPYLDYGSFTKERCDYPEYALKVANSIASGECEKGILVCGTGVGISISANKVKNIRCVVCSEPYSAILSRKHNDTNILALGARVVGTDLALLIVESWLNAVFERGRHEKRIEQIKSIEINGKI